MKFEYTIYPEKRLITTKLSGKVSAEGLVKTYQTLVSDPDFDHNYDLLGDMSDGAFVGTPEEHLKTNKALEQDIPPNKGRSALITNMAIDSALCILLKESLQGTREVGLFSTRKAAEKWLGIEQ